MNSNLRKMPTVTNPSTNQNNHKNVAATTTATTTTNAADTIALLKRVENLRKWQAEETKKLQEAHEMQMKQYKTEQEKIAKRVLQIEPENLLLSSGQKQNGFSHQGDDEEDDDEEDEEYAYQLKYQQQQQQQQKFLLSTFSSKQMSLLLMSNQQQQQQNGGYTNGNHLVNSNGDDDDEYEIQNGYEDEEEMDDEDYLFQDIGHQLTSAAGISAVDNGNDRLSTILEVSCEENTPLKQQQNKRLSEEAAIKRKALFNNVQEEDEEELEEQVNDEEQQSVGEQEEEEEGDARPAANNLDDIPVSGKGKSFEELLEEKLKEEKQAAAAAAANGKPVAKKFLKRGEGLQRFKAPPPVKQQEQQNGEESFKKPAAPPARSRSSSSNMNNEDKQQQQNNTAHKSRITASKQSATQVKANSKPPQQIKQAAPKAVAKVTRPAAKGAPPKPQNNTSTAKSKQSETVQNNKPKAAVKQPAKSEEREEDSALKEFEALEQYADEHPSFRSTASYVEDLMTDFQAPSKTQYHNKGGKGAGLNPKLIDLIEELNENENNYAQMLNNNDNSRNLEETLVEEADNEVDYSSQKIVQRKVKRLNYDYVESSDDDGVGSSSKLASNNNHHHHNNDEADYGENFALSSIRKRLGSMDFVQSSQESVHEVLKQQQRMTSNNNNNTKQYNSDTYTSTSQIEVPVDYDANETTKCDFDDNNTWLDMKENLSAFNHHNQITSKGTVTTVAAAPVSDLMAKLFPTLKPPAVAVQQQKPQQQKVADVQSNNSSNNAMGGLLKEKLTQLESEIEKFRANNAETKKLKDKHENDLKQLEKSVAEFENQKLEELRRLKEYKDDEMKKLKAEKKIFEQYKSSLKENPDRRERDEIDRLKKQVGELTDELKQKESRWLANNKRLKDRIETLEKEKEEMKQELMVLEKQILENRIQQQQQQQQQPKVMMPHQVTNKDSQPKQQQQQQMFKPHQMQETIFVDSTLDSISSSENHHMNKIISPNNNYVNMASPSLPPQPSTNTAALTRSISEKSISSYGGGTSNASSTKATVKYQANTIPTRVSMSPTSTLSPTTQSMPQSHIPEMAAYMTNASNNIANIYLNGGSTTQHHQQQPIIVNNHSNNNTKTVKFKIDAQEHQLVNGHHHQQQQDTQSKQFITTLISNRQVKLKDIRKCEDGRIEKLLDDGTIMTEFANGTVKEVSPDKRHTLVNFYNGDRKEMNLDAGTETYYYALTKVTQVTYTANGGLQIFTFPNGQIEKHYANKTKEIIFPDKIIKFIYPDGTEESRLTNGTVIKVEKNGDKVIDYPNKQREIHTKDYKRREYPDGSVKTVYSNGMSETRYTNGRVRVKDEFGNIISDKKA